ncbi:MAG: hypothetical protein EOM50_01170 [Erysipelotrichia bacterium]|nr:hypothetical protein [Erysipelotrichia bacterium]NCC54614.1 hypothetical protein [Erysipelotrichia bacterium]
MKKQLFTILLCMLLFGCTNSTNTQMKTIQNTLKDANYQIKKEQLESMSLLELHKKNTTFLISYSDEKINFISYHRNYVNVYISYINEQKTYIGEIKEDEDMYCTLNFSDQSKSGNCNKRSIEELNKLKKQMDKDLSSLDLTINDLSKYALWELTKEE